MEKRARVHKKWECCRHQIGCFSLWTRSITSSRCMLHFDRCHLRRTHARAANRRTQVHLCGFFCAAGCLRCSGCVCPDTFSFIYSLIEFSRCKFKHFTHFKCKLLTTKRAGSWQHTHTWVMSILFGFVCPFSVCIRQMCRGFFASLCTFGVQCKSPPARSQHAVVCTSLFPLFVCTLDAIVSVTLCVNRSHFNWLLPRLHCPESISLICAIARLPFCSFAMISLKHRHCRPMRLLGSWAIFSVNHWNRRHRIRIPQPPYRRSNWHVPLKDRWKTKDQSKISLHRRWPNNCTCRKRQVRQPLVLLSIGPMDTTIRAHTMRWKFAPHRRIHSMRHRKSCSVPDSFCKCHEMCLSTCRIGWMSNIHWLNWVSMNCHPIHSDWNSLFLLLLLLHHRFRCASIIGSRDDQLIGIDYIANGIFAKFRHHHDRAVPLVRNQNIRSNYQAIPRWNHITESVEAFVALGRIDQILGPFGVDTAESAMADGRNAFDAHHNTSNGYRCHSRLGKHFGRHQRRWQKRWILRWQIGSRDGNAAFVHGWGQFPRMLGRILECIQISNGRTHRFVEYLHEKSEQHEEHSRNDEFVDDTREFPAADGDKSRFDNHNIAKRIPSNGLSCDSRWSISTEFHDNVNVEYIDDAGTEQQQKEVDDQMGLSGQICDERR